MSDVAPATAWDESLTAEQRDAAAGIGNARRVLAGPGTGKTFVLTRRILYLAQVEGVKPEDILALTFTRAATYELRDRVRAGLGEGAGLPRIQTLHSFALRQLLKNWNKLPEVGEPLRIADDWETRNIIIEDIKHLTKSDVRATERRFRLLSADWETLNAEQTGWDQSFPEPEFLGAWREHRSVFGYVLPAELVYTLKRALAELGPAFELERPTAHLIVDEYQDLNKCDLAIIRALSDLGVKPYIAGDDDQSIYGFRFAHPNGIREFPGDYAPVDDLQLTLCKRCDPEILDLALFVARQDFNREKKAITAEEGRDGGIVGILRFDNQYEEAEAIARLASWLINEAEVPPHEVLILLRSDRNGIYSREILDALGREKVPAVAGTGDTPFDKPSGRRVLALVRLAVSPDDHLALRALLQLTPGIGEMTLKAVYDLAKAKGITFSSAVREIVSAPALIGGGNRIATSATENWKIASDLSTQLAKLDISPSAEDLASVLEGLVNEICKLPDAQELSAYVRSIISLGDVGNTADFLKSLTSLGDAADRQIEPGKVNILTMHKAKGLTADSVIVVGCEDELIPGRNESDPELGDERRLLYVSLTRAKHVLLVSYCLNRSGAQSHSGRRQTGPKRRLTRFLRDGPVAPESGKKAIRDLVA